MSPDGLARVEQAVAELCAGDIQAQFASRFAAGRSNTHVCFDADGVLWRADAGTDYLMWCIEGHILQPEQEAIARQSWEAFGRGEVADERMAAICAEILQGLREDFVAADTRTLIQARFRTLLIPEIAAWIARLQESGVKCWVVSGSNRWAVAAGAEMVGIPAERVLAVANVVRDGVLCADLVHPITYGEGKADAIRQFLPELPAMAFGNTMNDAPMLRLATKLAVAVEPDAALRDTARSLDWAILS